MCFAIMANSASTSVDKFSFITQFVHVDAQRLNPSTGNLIKFWWTWDSFVGHHTEYRTDKNTEPALVNATKRLIMYCTN